MTTSTPAAIAVHIVTHNNADTIGACLSALKQQTIPFELCIIDNASQDSTADHIRQLGYPVIVNLDNWGYSAAHNQALTHTSSPIVITLNADVRLMPDFLEQMVTAFQLYPNAGALAGLLLRVDAPDQEPYCVDSCGLYIQPNYRQRLRFEGRSLDEVPQLPHMIFGPDGAAAAYRRTMLENIVIDGEIFDEDFFIQKEDIDLCWRLQFQGWDAIFIPSARACHIRGFRPGKRHPVDKTNRYYSVRNRYLLFLKHARWPLSIRFLPHILLYDLAILLYLLLYEQSSLPALWDALRLAPRMWHKRRRIKEQQIASDKTLLRWFSQSEECDQQPASISKL